VLARPDGSLAEDSDELETMTNQFYANMYVAEGTIGMEEVLPHVPVKVDALMNAKMNEPYCKEHVWVVLFQMFPTKASCPDGNKLRVHQFVGTPSAECCIKRVFPHNGDSGFNIIRHYLFVPIPGVHTPFSCL
jgi:hypothetical protein